MSGHRGGPVHTRDSAVEECPVCCGNKFEPDFPDRPCRMCFGAGFVRRASPLLERFGGKQ